MEIIITIKPMLRFMGLMYNHSNNSFLKLLHGAFWFLATISFIVPETAYLYVNIDDVIKASDAIIFIAVKVMTTIKLLIFYYHKEKYTLFLNNMQENVNIKVKENRVRNFVQAEKDCKFFTQLFYTLFITGINLGIVLPLVVVTYNYIIGQLTPDIWYLPFPIVLFYDTDTTPGFQITYCFIAISITAVVCNYCSMDSLFVGMCIHLRAGFIDLQDMIIELNNSAQQHFRNDNIEQSPLLYHSEQNYKEMLRFRKNLRNCMQYQDFLINNFNILEEITSGIIFTQFGGTVFILCTNIFQITTSYQNGKILSYLNFWVLYISQLFVYAYYGNMLSTELLKISTTIYSSLWYRRPPIVRHQFYLMILNTQVERYLRGFQYVNCSMENLSSVIRSALSAVALLRSVKEKLNYTQ